MQLHEALYKTKTKHHAISSTYAQIPWVLLAREQLIVEGVGCIRSVEDLEPF